jgi:hypothetical protein
MEQGAAQFAEIQQQDNYGMILKLFLENDNIKYLENMKKLTIDLFIVVFGVAIVAATGHMVILDPEVGQDQNHLVNKENFIEIDQLPEPVRETLKQEYSGWNPSEATVDRNRDGIFYEIKLNNREKGEIKTITISDDGDVISEEGKSDSRKDYRGKVWFI